MNSLIIIIMIIVIIMTIFSLIIVIRDLILDNKERKKIIIEVKKDKQIIEENKQNIKLDNLDNLDNLVAEKTINENNIKTFLALPKLTHLEKYMLLNEEKKSWYDEIINYAKEKENVKHRLTENYEDVKLYSKRVIRMVIKREEIICEFILGNNRFNDYMKQKNLNVKILPTQLKIDSIEAKDAAKESIDLTIHSIMEERNLKKELKKKGKIHEEKN